MVTLLCTLLFLMHHNQNPSSPTNLMEVNKYIYVSILNRAQLFESRLALTRVKI